MLVAIAGRKHSGKTTLCNILLKKGFQRASFAAGLKEYLGKLYNWSPSDLDTQLGKEEILKVPVLWNRENCEKLSRLIDSDLIFDKEMVFETRRDALQYIGTEVLRNHDPDFHLNEFKKRFSNGNYVCDDVRFQNELLLLESMGALCCYIIRPYYWCYSNHSSEIDLSYKSFKYIFMNNKSLKTFIRKSELFFDNQFGENKKSYQPRFFSTREHLIELLEKNNYDTTACANEIGCSRDTVVWWATKHNVYISRNFYSLDHEAFSLPNFENSYWAGVLSADGTIKKHLKYDYLLELSNLDENIVFPFKEFLKTEKKVYKYKQKSNGKTKYQFAISSPYIIEDLKKWNIEPKKSKFNKVPDCIKENDYLISQWLVGLIDGDGSIFFIKTNGQIKNICVTVLASKQIIDYVVSYLGLEGGCVCSEKGIENLYNYKVVGKNAIHLYKKIYKGQGLKRKWDKFTQFETLFPEKFR
jgi:hypothetical protein